MNENLQEILKIAEVESEVWAEVQITILERQFLGTHPFDRQSSGHSRVCIIDGA